MTTTAPETDVPTTIYVAGVETEVDTLRWWRRPRRLRRQLAGSLLLVAFLSVALVGGLNFIAGRRLLDEGTQQQLVGVGEARARSIEVGIERALGQISAAAADLAVVAALEDLDDAFETLAETPIDEAELAELDAAYQQGVIEPINEAGLGPVTLDDVRPQSDAGRYIQYHYIAGDDLDADRRELVDPGDGSTYSQVHAEVHPDLVSLAGALGVGDMLLISARTGDIVYSVEKRIDVGTNLFHGPYQDTALAEAVLEGLSRVRVGESVLADQGIYIPGGGRPVVFVAASVRRDTEVVGALVVEIPIEALNAITTAEGQWEAVGLGAGESYVVSDDLLLRSESRLWIEDPSAYLDRTSDAELAGLIQTFDSPVGLQPVDTEPAREAFEGRTFDGTARNYLGQQTFAYSTPIEAAGVAWVMVAEVPLGDARGPLVDYVKRLGLVLLIILPAAALIGIWLADRLTRPIPPVVDAARAVAAGERDPELPDLGKDEFGDLARRLGRMANELGRQEAELESEYERTRQLLLTVLPPRILEGDGVEVGSGEAADIATVVAVGVDVARGDADTDDDELADLLTRVLETAEQTATDRGIERIRAAADRYLFLAGMHNENEGADEALDFAVALAASVRSIADSEDVALAVHVGLSSGPVATGVLQQGSLTFGVWGEPVRRALAIAALSKSDEILVDASTSAVATDDRWPLEPANDVVALDGRPMTLLTLATSAG